MAIINKEKYLKDIAASVMRGAMLFEKEDRPALNMNGREVFISGVYYDLDRGELAYSVSDARNRILPSVHGVRMLADLDVFTLADVSDTVSMYHDYSMSRARSLETVRSAMKSPAVQPAAAVAPQVEGIFRFREPVMVDSPYFSPDGPTSFSADSVFTAEGQTMVHGFYQRPGGNREEANVLLKFFPDKDVVRFGKAAGMKMEKKVVQEKKQRSGMHL